MFKERKKVIQLCPTLCDPMECSLPDSSVHGIFQARVLEWGAIAQPLNGAIWFRDPFLPSPGTMLVVLYFFLLNLTYLICSLITFQFSSVQFISVTQSCLTLCDPMNCSMPGHPVHHQLPEFTKTHVHRVSDAIQPSYPLSSPSPPVPDPSQHQGLFQ